MLSLETAEQKECDCTSEEWVTENVSEKQQKITDFMIDVSVRLAHSGYGQGNDHVFTLGSS